MHLGEFEDDGQPLWPSDASSTFHGMNDRVEASDADNFTYSLRLVHVDALAISVFAPGASFNNPKRRVQGAFSYLGVQYRVWVTDPMIERAFLAKPDGSYRIGECYLTMSLSEPSDDGYCYKLIAAVITRDRAAGGA